MASASAVVSTVAAGAAAPGAAAGSTAGIPAGAPTGATPVCPPHPGYLFDLCIRCGSARPPVDRDGQHAEAHVQFSYVSNSLVLSAAAASKMRGEEQERALGARKLFLVSLNKSHPDA